jgi:ribosomal-protein-alanine N-acetyltransferase
LKVSESTVIRRAMERDLAAIARIENESFSDPWSVADFRTVMHNPHAIFLVAADDATPAVAGYVVMLCVLDESEILNIAVDPARRGTALGGRLLDAGMAEAESRGSRTTFLDVRESNAAAKKLYESRGFEEISRRRKYYRSPVEDALILRRAVE